MTHNPADVGELLKAVPKGKRWPALLDLGEIRGLVAAVDRAGANPVTRLASRFMALTAQRPDMIRSAPWSEFHDISWSDDSVADENAYWLITAERMKLELELKGDDAFDHGAVISDVRVLLGNALKRYVCFSKLVALAKGAFVGLPLRPAFGDLPGIAVGFLDMGV